MKFIGKLFVITALLVGINIPQIAYAAPAGSTNSPQDKALNQSGEAAKHSQLRASNVQIKAAEKKSGQASAIVSAGNPSDNLPGQVNINSANAEQLAQQLSGIGKKKAEAIITYREQFGPFTDAEQLLEVPGIGPSFLERNSTKLKI
ncbi:ComEA family DNA-binding protein [Yersinia sp. Marseille-Q3913]|uniref:ComEA family DNA-binding protein n=1 Tax=Yersinia sp. Marseille-Q3913 TaxID=2830769 RepID=UPI001BAFF7DC|nr:ComEA family DNA-binding protein [Yersinia sp. Marseille-Q3913]MBS0054315.1 ComEA family DNA-binding protein [Yersinia sp. Marseille-Q3913]